jgi:hypothetical protein
MSSSVKLAFANAVTLTKTNANIASSATAGWQSDGQDNTSNLYLDALVQCDFAAVNTAPANNKAIYIFAFGCADGSGSNYGSTGSGVPSGTEGTLTFPDITTLAPTCPLVGTIQYPVQNKQLISAPMSIANCFGGILPAKYAIGMINYSGMTLSVTSIKIIPVYNTVG